MQRYRKKGNAVAPWPNIAVFMSKNGTTISVAPFRHNGVAILPLLHFHSAIAAGSFWRKK